MAKLALFFVFFFGFREPADEAAARRKTLGRQIIKGIRLHPAVPGADSVREEAD